MQFFIVLSILVSASVAYLLHQFWHRSLSDPAADRGAPVADDGTDDQDRALKAA